MPVSAQQRLDEEMQRRASASEPDETFDYPDIIDLRTLAASDPKPPRFIVEDWLPEGDVTLFAGHGGSGKSAIGLYLAVCIVLGNQFWGVKSSRRSVCFVSLEDPQSVLHWRLQRICDWLDIRMNILVGRLTLIDGSRREASLFTETRDGVAFTSTFSWLKKQMQASQCEVLMIDGASDAYDANENQRRLVRRFVRGLRRLVPDHGAALLLAHVDKPTARNAETSEGYSGSTAWNNSVRARWYLTIDAEEDALLEVQKSNHGRKGSQIRMRWNESAHLFVGELTMPTSKIDRELANSDERDAILAALRACVSNRPPVSVPTAMTGPRTAYHVLSIRPEFPGSLRSGKASKPRFREQIERLRAMGAIVETTITRGDRHKTTVFELPSEERG